MSSWRWHRKALLVAAIFAVGFGGAAYARYRPSIHGARARVSTGSHIAVTRCGPIEYAEQGDGAPVLVVHGAGGGFDQALDLAEGLTRAGYRVIAPSRFGYLRTPLPADGSAEAQADAHACLLDALHVPAAVIMGVSAGGPSSLQFALRFPDRTRALVLLVPATYSPNHTPVARASRLTMFVFDAVLRSDFLFWAGNRVAPRAYLRTILGTPPELVAAAPPDEQARLQTAIDHILPVSARRQGLLNDARVVSSLPRYALERITAPTIAISTEDDGYGTFAGARYTAEHIPGARFLGYPSGGHMLVGRSPDASAQTVAFLRGLGPDAHH